MAETEKKPDAPPPAPPGASVLLEQGLIALVDAPGAFARLAARPAPSPGTSILAGLAWGLAFFGLNAAHAVASGAAARFAGFPAWQFAAVGALALAAWASLLLLGAAVLYALGRALAGTSSDFDRALEVAAVAAAAGVLQAAAAFVPVLWFLPAAAAAWIVSCGLIALSGAGAAGARAACALLAGLALGAQYAAGLALAGAAARLPEGPASMEAVADVQKQLEGMQEIVTQADATAAATGASGLDLLRGPGGEEPGERELTLAERRAMVENMSAQGDAMNKSVLGMLDSLAPMLQSAASSKNLTPQQKADFAQLTKSMNVMRESLASGKPMTAQQHADQMMKIQEMSMRLMTAGLTAPPAAAAPAEKRK
ncbi:MAG: hypothetical protein M0D55_12015 [Elusimicrobiota bacterium]|nr:MAG: hypothetical protein M0D55_12015 [Elusimicrobiota bacterium]